MKLHKSFLFCFMICIFVHFCIGAILVHNSLKEINSCKGKLHLKLIRIWGGDNEQDESKFFSYPSSITISNKNFVYISDSIQHCIKVFDFSGKHLYSIGQKGIGPSDLLGPETVCIYANGDILVNEGMGHRFQRFTSEGKSSKVIKSNNYNQWIALTKNEEIAVYSHKNTFFTRRLISIIDQNGKKVNEFGKYTDNSRDMVNAERLIFTKDEYYNIYALNKCLPVVRKYSPDGKLIMAITFESPFKLKGKIGLTSDRNEIEVIDTDDSKSMEIKNTGNSVSLIKKNETDCSGVSGLGVDSLMRIYLISLKRKLTEKEMLATRVSGNRDHINRELVDYNIVENINIYQLIVFNSNGKVIAVVDLNSFCNGIYLNGNRIYILDGELNQRILEYEMIYRN